MIPELETSRQPAYAVPVRDLYILDLGDAGRVEVRRHGTFLSTLVHTPRGEEPAEFDLRRWHYRQWSTQIEDREYAEGLRALIARHSLFEHPAWVTRDRPLDLDAESMAVIDDLRATWRSRFGSRLKPPGAGAQQCKECIASEPPRGPLTVWSPAPSQQACPHRDAAARGLLLLAEHHTELVFELLDLLVVAQTPGAGGAPTLRRLVLPSDWMRALLGHWLLGQDYVHGDRPWRSRGAAKPRRFAQRDARTEPASEMSEAERHSCLAWGINAEDLGLPPVESDDVVLPDSSWWTDVATPPAGVRVYPEGAQKASAPAALPSTAALERSRATPRVSPVRVARQVAPVAPPVPAPRVEVAREVKPARPVKPKRSLAKGRASKAHLDETLSSLTAGLAALSQIMGGTKTSRR